MRLADLTTRDDIGKVLNAMGLKGTGVEVGVEYGINAELILNTSSLRHLWLVDAWKYIDGHDPRGFGVGYTDWESVYEDCVKRMAPFGLRHHIMRMPSADACRYFSDSSLDFVYIDANHMSPWIDQDIVNWIGKVKVGGIIGGHDYLQRNEPAFQCDVKNVVNEFFDSRFEPVYVTEDEVPSWYAVKVG